jgi:hypothetical protein
MENQSKEELRKKLREKIKNKSANRSNGITRKKGNDLNDNIKKIGELLKSNNIDSPEKINEDLINSISSLISKKDLELIINNMKDNEELKNIFNQINQKIDK